MSSSDILFQSPRDAVLELINTTNSITPPLTFSDVRLNQPATLSDSLQDIYRRNTKVSVVSLLASGPDNTVNVYYNRLDIALLFGQTDVPVNTDIETADDVLVALGQEYGLVLNEDDVTSIVINSDYSATIVMGNSYLFIPGSTIRVVPDTELTRLEAQSERLKIFINQTLPAIVGTITESGS